MLNFMYSKEFIKFLKKKFNFICKSWYGLLRTLNCCFWSTQPCIHPWSLYIWDIFTVKTQSIKYLAFADSNAMNWAVTQWGHELLGRSMNLCIPAYIYMLWNLFLVLLILVLESAHVHRCTAGHVVRLWPLWSQIATHEL